MKTPPAPHAPGVSLRLHTTTTWALAQALLQLATREFVSRRPSTPLFQTSIPEMSIWVWFLLASTSTNDHWLGPNSSTPRNLQLRELER
jgi:hypothetical protein